MTNFDKYIEKDIDISLFTTTNLLRADRMRLLCKDSFVIYGNLAGLVSEAPVVGNQVVQAYNVVCFRGSDCGKLFGEQFFPLDKVLPVTNLGLFTQAMPKGVIPKILGKS